MLREKQLRDYVNGYSFQNAMGLRGYEEINLFPLGCGEYNLNYSFVHPITGEQLRFDSELPDYFTHFLATLRRGNV